MFRRLDKMVPTLNVGLSWRFLKPRRLDWVDKYLKIQPIIMY